MNKFYQHSRQYFRFISNSSNSERCKILVVGGGTGGCSVAAKLCSKFGAGKVTILDSAEKHYYQPMFTLIGGGMKTLDQSYRIMKTVLPKNANWIQENAKEFNPANNTVITSTGRQISYDILLIATGLNLYYDKIPGLLDVLNEPNQNVCSIYSPKYVNKTYEILQRAQKGNSIFTFPATPVKCPGAPQKITYIAEEYFRKNNKRKDMNIIYNTSLPVIFGVKRYADALWKVVEKRNIQVNVRRNLIAIKPSQKVAIFENLDNPSEQYESEYEMLHVTPPMGPPKELSTGQDLVNEAGFVNVDKNTLQHIKYENIFAIGDCSSTPNSKTAAAAAAQSQVVYQHILSVLDGSKNLTESYDGYASCPLVTGYSSCILAEFDYNLQPLETFPIPQNRERYSMFFMKKELMPILYWHIMLNGYWNGPATMRKYMSFLKTKDN